MSRDDAKPGAQIAPDEVALRALGFVVSLWLGPDAPLRLTIDDPSVGWAAGESCLIVVGVAVRLPLRRARSLCLPLLVRRYRGREPGRPDRPSTFELIRRLVCLIAEGHPRRRLHVVASERCASRALRGLPDNVTVTVEMRDNPVIHGPTPPRTGRPGRPRLQGDRLGSLSDLAAAGGFAEAATTKGTIAAKRIVGQWYPVFAAQPVQIVLARRPGSRRPFDVAVASTDLDAGAAELLARQRFGRADATSRRSGGQPAGVGRLGKRILVLVARDLPVARS